MHDLREKRQNVHLHINLLSFSLQKRPNICQSSLPYLVSNPAVIQIQFNHNHPIQSAHTIPISPETKKAFLKQFCKGHSASSAHHWHETRLLLNGNEDQLMLAN